jgi:uncharacterized membrane protein
MKLRAGTLALLLLLAALGAFVWRTSQELPPLVASHFAASGAANGFMPRGTYVTTLLVLIIGVPLLLAALPSLIVSRRGGNVRIPNREHWLAPQRRAATFAFIGAHGQWFAAAVALFLADVHWLVVQANQAQPPVLATSAIQRALVVFAAALALWLFLLYRRFRVRDEGSPDA